MTDEERQPADGARVRMTGRERREQLVQIGRALFAEKGFDGTSIEEIAARAKVSKPVVYEHFGGKEGLYAVVVDREMSGLLDRLTRALSSGHSRELSEQAALALLTYIEDEPDGFHLLSRDSRGGSTGAFSSLLNDVANQVEHVLAREFVRQGMDPQHAPMYAQMLVGMVALTGMWWLEERTPPREVVAAHIVNLGWNGLARLEANPTPLADPSAERTD
ncbi:TetR/AcrR family transcriptional regulator [uncultured Jatrophihabitans sp.]|uniref:TetR/AcrR family transcriptional regulator n=1 Tax=uncultured Jatrophihabitans sp. TaxID=1610747 RepID=UPI0035C99D21